MQLIKTNAEEYFATARERYRIYLKRSLGRPRPWTEDPVFRIWRFCNVFREDDVTTVWIRDHIREPLKDKPTQLLTAMVACRLFNRVLTLQRLLDSGALPVWDADAARKALVGVRPVVGSAYMIKTPDNLKKAEGVLEVMRPIATESWMLLKYVDPGQTSLQEVWELIKMWPFIGPFLAYEVVTDLRHTPLLENAPDIMTWANPGPGACRGLKWLGVKTGREQQIVAMQQLLHMSQREKYWPRQWPQWEMREVEHFCCEYFKYVKVAHLGLRMKRRYL
jgi:hypothetical protein